MSVINTNVAANNTYRLMSMASEDKASSMEKLSSGLRINRAADDAAGLSIAEGLKSQANGLEVAARNAQDGINVIQTAEGGLSSAHDILQRVRDLSVQFGNDSNNKAAREAIATEVDALGQELERMGDSINFNGIKLLNGATAGSGAGKMSFQVGANAVKDQIDVDLTGADLKTMGDTIKTLAETLTTAAADTTGGLGATAGIGAITTVDGEIAKVSAARSNLGAVQNRLEQTIKHVNISAENLAAAESSIRDVDMAKEIVKQSAASIKEQASQAMLAQANQASQGVLQLLR